MYPQFMHTHTLAVLALWTQAYCNFCQRCGVVPYRVHANTCRMAGRGFAARNGRPAQRSAALQFCAATLLAVSVIAAILFVLVSSTSWLTAYHRHSTKAGPDSSRPVEDRELQAAYRNRLHVHAGFQTSSGHSPAQGLSASDFLESIEPTDASLQDIAASSPAALADRQADPRAAESANFVKNADAAGQ